MTRLILLLLLGLTTGCSTLYYRAGQPALIGEPQAGTPTHTVVQNRDGEVFRLPRRSIGQVRFGGMRTVLWSLLTGDAILIMAPIGLVQWAREVDLFGATDVNRTDLIDVADEEEVDASELER